MTEGKPNLNYFAELLRQYAPYDAAHELRVPGVYAVRASRMNGELFHTVYRPSVCIVAQGAKSVYLGSDVFEYDASRMLMFSVELPVASQVTQASAAEPFLCLKVDLNPQRIAELSLKVFSNSLPPVKDSRGVGVGQVTPGLVRTATRLLEVLADEREVAMIAPLVLDELLIRLLWSSLGARVAQIGQGESSVQRVSKAVEWVREHYDQPMNVEALAEMVNMSLSSFHQHFKAVTALSPLQFQKELRLREARRLMLTAQLDATSASRQVGYVSSSQFSREYARLFGHSPSRDISRLRAEGLPPVGVT